MKKTTRFLSVLLAVFLLISSVPLMASAQERYEVIEEYQLNIGEDGVTVEFVPEHDGWYGFYTTGYYDTYGDLLDSDYNDICYSDDTDDDLNLYLKGKLKADETYYLQIYMYDYEEGKELPVTLCVEEAVYAVDAKLYETAENTCVRGAEMETANISDLLVEFELSDGSKVYWDYDSYVDIAGSYVETEFLCDEEGNILEVDGKAFLKISLDDVGMLVEYTVLDNPVESFEINAEFVMYENYGGYEDEESGIYYYMYLFDEDDTVTVHYKDGTSVTEQVMFFCDEYGCGIDTYDTQEADPWGVGEDNFFYATYMGHKIQVPVEVVAVPIRDIEVTKLPDKIEYEEIYQPLWDGAEITITLLDGTTIKETVSDDDLVYDAYSDEYTLNIDEYELKIYFWYDEMDEPYYAVSCFGVEERVYDFVFTRMRRVKEMNVIKATPTGEGTIIEVEYMDGTKETFEFDVMDYWEPMDFVFGRVKTVNGHTDYAIEPVYDDKDEVTGYNYWFLDEYVFVPVDDMVFEPAPGENLLGDADVNGTVNIKDATAIQKHIAGLTELSKVGEEVADADLNGDVNIKDATAIQKWIAGIETGLPIGGVVAG